MSLATNPKIKAFTEKYAEIWKFAKFAFTGASTSILEMGVYAFLYYVLFVSLNSVPVTENAFFTFLGIEYQGYFYSYLFSAIIGYAAAYIMNRKLTFQSNANVALSTFLYALMVIFTIIVNTWLGSYLSTLLENAGYMSGLVNMVVKLIVMTIPTLWTYPLSRFVIHRKKKPVEETEAKEA